MQRPQHPLRRRAHAHGRRRRAGGGRAFPRPHRGLRARRGGGAAGRRQGRRAAARDPRRRHPVGRERRHLRRHRRRRRQGVRRPTPRATAGWSRPTPSAAGSTMSRPAPTARWRGRPASRLSCMAGKGEPKLDRGAVHRRRAGLRAEGRAARRRPLQRRVDVVSERAGRARGAGVEGLAPPRRLQPERPVPGHGDAGAGAARLARRRRQAHADVGLFGAGALVRLDRGRQVARHRRAPSSSCCGRSRARTARWASSRKMFAAFAVRVTDGRLPSQAGGGRGRLCRRHRAAGADRRRRRGAGARSRASSAGHRARLGRAPARCWPCGHRGRRRRSSACAHGSGA